MSMHPSPHHRGPCERGEKCFIDRRRAGQQNAAMNAVPYPLAPSLLAPSLLSPSVLPGFILRPALASRWLDAILRRRAADILRRSGLSDMLPRQGLLLDLGAGTGHIAEAVRLAATARHCVLLDPVHVPATRLARRTTRGLSWLTGNGLCLPFPPALFDGAWAAFVLHHVAPVSQERMLAEVARVLRPGAPFVLLEDTPDDARAAAATLRADRRLNFERRAAPHHYRTPDAWPAVLARHGLVVTEQRSFTGVFPRASLAPVPHTAYLAHRVA